jgi:hypothetical protein
MCGVVESHEQVHLLIQQPFIISPGLRNSRPPLPFQLKHPPTATFKGCFTVFYVRLGSNLSNPTGLLHLKNFSPKCSSK